MSPLSGMADGATVTRAPLVTRGFTLLELAVVLTVGAALLVWGMPSIVTSIRNNDVAAQSVSLLALLNFTKSEAIRRGTGVDLVLTMTGDGWDAVVEDPNNETAVPGCVPGQLRCTSQRGALLSIPSAQPSAEGPLSESLSESQEPAPVVFTITFNNRGYIRGTDDPWTPQTIFLQHEQCAGLNQRTRIDITPTGQISSCSLACGSTAACP